MALRLLVTAQSDPQGRIFRYDFDDDRGQILLGRRGGVDVLLPHASVSLVHARIERRGDAFVVIDDGSVNGTQLNGARLEPGSERPLKQGDRIGIAEFTLEVDEARGDEGPVAAESSLSIARRMVADVLGVLGPGDQHPTLAVIDGALDGVRLTLSETGRTYVVGREAGCDFELADPSVARRHARVLRGDRGDVVVADLGSPSGLYVNDRFVSGERSLRDGDLVAIGRLRLRFSDPAETYLRRLEQVSPSPAPRPITEGRLPRLPRVSGPPRVELLVVAGAIGVGVTALAALLWVWLS